MTKIQTKTKNNESFFFPYIKLAYQKKKKNIIFSSFFFFCFWQSNSALERYNKNKQIKGTYDKQNRFTHSFDFFLFFYI